MNRAHRPGLGVVGLVVTLTLASCASPAPSASTSSPTSQPATPSPSPKPASWIVTELPAPAGVAGCSPQEGIQNLLVAGFGSGLIALGSCGHTTNPSLVWVSADGRSWQAGAPPVLAHADIYDLVVADGLIIAVGQDVTDGYSAAAWTSRDGLLWTRSHGELGCAVMSTVTRHGSKFVAFGSRVPQDVPGDGFAPGLCEWVSSDGLSWEPVIVAAGVFPTAFVASLSSGPLGLVAAGSEAGPDGQVGILWHSSDGRTWSQGERPISPAWYSVDLAIATGWGLLIFGNGPGGHWLASSADLSTWTTTRLPGNQDFLSLEGRPVAFGPAGLISLSCDFCSPDATAWTSSDGVSWQPLPAVPSGFRYHAAASVAAGFVIAASTADGKAVIIRLQP